MRAGPFPACRRRQKATPMAAQPYREKSMRRSSPLLASLLVTLLSPLSQAAPQLQAWLDQQQLQLRWHSEAGQRYSSKLELQPGLLTLRGSASVEPAQALALYQRQAWQADSHLSMQVPTAGRYR